MYIYIYTIIFEDICSITGVGGFISRGEEYAKGRLFIGFSSTLTPLYLAVRIHHASKTPKL